MTFKQLEKQSRRIRENFDKGRPVEKAKMKVIVTKWAMGLGVKIVDIVPTGQEGMWEEKALGSCYGNYFYSRDFCESKETAIADVHARFEKKRASLEKQLKRLATKRQTAMEAIEKAEL